MSHTTTRTTYSFDQYMALTEQLVAEGKTTGPNQSEAFAHYTKMNLQRMRRLNKTTQLTEALQAAVAQVDRPLHFLVLTEAWCGDAAQNIPIMAKMAEANPHIQLEFVLRDENLDLMDQHLTNGGRSIPKMLVNDPETGETLTTWGPRPEPVQKMVLDRKAQPAEEQVPYTEFILQAQKWYNKDKTLTTQAELTEVMAQL